MVHFKSAVTAVRVVSSASKKSKRTQCSKKKSCLCLLEDCTNNLLQEPLHQLAAAGSLETLKEAVQTFSLTLRETDGNLSTLLHHATSANQVLVMKYLLENCIEVDSVDKDGNTALHVASSKGHVEAIKLLLCSGASTTITNYAKDPPVHTAAREKSGRALRAYVHAGSDITVKGFRNRTIVHAIAETDNVEGVKVLYEQVIENVKDEVAVCNFPNSPGSIHAGHMCSCSKDDDGLTAVHLAARNNSYQFLEFLIQHCKAHTTDSLLGFVNGENSTSLHAAVDAGNFEVACILLKYGACPLVLKGDIPPPLHLACSQGRVDMVKAMIESCGTKKASTRMKGPHFTTAPSPFIAAASSRSLYKNAGRGWTSTIKTAGGGLRSTCPSRQAT